MIETSENFIFDCLKLSIVEIKRVLDPIFGKSSIMKYMFDCRSDVDALYHQYNIKLAGVVDAKLYEVGFRKCNGLRTGFCYGLFKTLNENSTQIGITMQEMELKKKHSDQFTQNQYELNINDTDFLRYLSIDVIYLKRIYLIFREKTGNGQVRNKIKIETEKIQNCWIQSVYINVSSCALSAS